MRGSSIEFECRGCRQRAAAPMLQHDQRAWSYFLPRLGPSPISTVEPEIVYRSRTLRRCVKNPSRGVPNCHHDCGQTAVDLCWATPLTTVVCSESLRNRLFLLPTIALHLPLEYARFSTQIVAATSRARARRGNSRTARSAIALVPGYRAFLPALPRFAKVVISRFLGLAGRRAFRRQARLISQRAPHPAIAPVPRPLRRDT